MRFFLAFITTFSLISYAYGEETITGVLEEEVSENFKTGKIDHRFSIKDETTGIYYFVDAKEIKKKGMKSGERVRIRGEKQENRRIQIKETQKILREE
ncbi:hypothetical protein [Microbulbifer sp. THAF38]|uniref:hypothetical protein n=1 Tax=Microbulbifer sp. THAF38 TaxID=2587856 RepID=UPI001268A26F|nr:hypothetical protein [Microbulbifer sp. THAF38]QFT55695.1 hypothetical protein FIU95_14190 [Microbulbifer sp. THAF38]